MEWGIQLKIVGERKLDRCRFERSGIGTIPVSLPHFLLEHPVEELMYPQQQLTFSHDLFLVYCNFDAQSLCQFTQGTGDEYDWLFNRGTTSSAPETGPSADVSSTGQELQVSLVQPL